MGDDRGGAERRRLEDLREGRADWRRWGPYLAERAWGTVREDYSADGTAWEYLDHGQARSRAYRWSEDGMGGICDAQQRLCLAFAFWNGRDPILKERAFGLAGNQGNHGEDVKEQYFYLDATPTHSFLRYLYKYPQAEYPYARLVAENARRTRADPPFGLLDTGVFDAGRYWDIEVTYAKAAPDLIHVRVRAANRGDAAATLHVLPLLWFRNTWSWAGDAAPRPQLRADDPPAGAGWAIAGEHATLGRLWCYGREPAETMFTENETNFERLWGVPNAAPYVKDAFHRRVVAGEAQAVNPARTGTRAAAWNVLEVAPGATAELDLVLSERALEAPFDTAAEVFARRAAEADAFHRALLPDGSEADRDIVRQALAGMIWNQQFYHYDVARWLDGDEPPPPPPRRAGRNRRWRHLRAGDVLSMPDTWEYPWFAAWDLAYQCATLALVDVDFAKAQIERLLTERYLHPNGQIPAYEWAFEDVNPPVHAMAALKVFRAERVQRGAGDLHFLHRVMHKLLMNYTWWLNRKDADGHNLFEGGFMGLDNISVYDRSHPLPPGHTLKQADATGWMAMFALNMTVIALELATENPDYEEVAIQCYTQFLAIADVIAGHAEHCISLWDPQDRFFKDLIVGPDGACHRIDVFSWVGIIPLFACEVLDRRLLETAPRFRALLAAHKGGLFDGHYICACPDWENERGEHLLSLVDHTMLPHILRRLLNEDEFLSPYGVRSLSRVHAERRDLGVLPGIGAALIAYEPGESASGLFGGNSNWRGPVWLPLNYSLIQALEKFHRFLGDGFRVAVPCLGGEERTLEGIARLIADRLAALFRPGPDGAVPSLPGGPFRHDPHWRDLLLFHEYFHAETGRGLGAAHQTGWTGLAANLVLRGYRRDIPAYWRARDGAAVRRSGA